MHLVTLAHLPMVAGAKLLLAATSPLQGFIDRPGITHEFCNQQALTVLRTDGFTSYADFLEQHLTELNEGVYWADKGWKNVSHYYEPSTGKGLWQFATAAEEFQLFFKNAEKSLRNNNTGKAVFWLGAAVHLVQDLCVPHHARGKLFCGHQEYETWAKHNHHNFAVSAKGTYCEGGPLSDLLVANANMAADMFSWVDTDHGGTAYQAASAILLPRAQRSSAGVFHYFCTIAAASLNYKAFIVA